MNISKLHFITLNNEKISHLKQVEQYCLGGAKWIQLRIKDVEHGKILQTAEEALQICRKYNSQLIINDYVDICAKINAGGVHLGKNDLPIDAARKELSPKYIIGGTANTYKDIENLYKQKVDYIGLGPFKFTKTKKNLSPVVGLHYYSEITQKLKSEDKNIPVIAIGGIKIEDIKNLIQTGIYGIAVSSAVATGEDIVRETERFINEVEKYS